LHARLLAVAEINVFSQQFLELLVILEAPDIVFLFPLAVSGRFALAG